MRNWELKNIDISKSILNELEDFHIQELYFDYLRECQGYTFHYVIDADEIHDYCHPFTKKPNKDLGVVADEKFVMEYLFRNKENKAIILEDYFDEITRLRGFILSTLKREKDRESIEKYKQTLVDFLQGLHKYEKKEDDDAYLKDVLKAYSFLLLISTDTYKVELSDLNHIMGGEIRVEGWIKDPQLSKYLGSYEMDYAFNKAIFDSFERKERSKADDVNAILKTYHLTRSYWEEATQEPERTEQEEIKNRIFYFVSSSTKDIQTLKNSILKNELSDDKFCFGVLKNNKATLIRSKSQIFALLIYSTLHPKDKDENPIDFTDFSKRIRQLIKKWDSNKEYKDLFKRLKQRGDLNIELIENLVIYHKKNEGALSQGKVDALDYEKFKYFLSKYGVYGNELRNKLKGLIQKANGLLKVEFGPIDMLSEYEMIKRYLELTEFEMEIIRGFIEKLKGSELEFDRGEDPIEGVFNSFPPLFTYPFYKQSLFALLKKVEKTKISSDEILAIIRPEEVLHRFYVFVIYLLLMIKYRYETRNYKNNFIVYENIKKLIKDYEENMEKSPQSFRFEKDYELVKDLYAIGCWAARRSRHYKYAYDLSDKALNKFSDDPRFNHSMALIGFCWKYEYDTTNQYEWSYENYFESDGEKSVLGHCRKAKEKYEEIGVTKNKELNYLVDNYISLLNLTAFTNIIKYKLNLEKKRADDNPMEILTEARDLINTMKSVYVSWNSDESETKRTSSWNDYPSYLHTEVYLEYYELLKLEKTIGMDNDSFTVKLSSALRDIDIAAQRCKELGKNALNKRCEHLKSKLKQLKLKV
ncbi:hypothetical protein [Flagellimonas sp.]|uniref:hypothetical protein n=1 Tax=Flagellimonas sp. TaxID=2058762 RepID=UPI003B59A484